MSACYVAAKQRPAKKKHAMGFGSGLKRMLSMPGKKAAAAVSLQLNNETGTWNYPGVESQRDLDC